MSAVKGDAKTEPEIPVPKPGGGGGTPPEGGGEGTPRPEKIVVELGKGRDLEIDYMMETTFWGPNGKQMTAAEFLTLLFGELPNFYKDEDDLRRIWSDPLTRIELLTRLEEHGFTTGDLRRIQELIAASESDLFDVLAFVSFDAERKTRSERASQAQPRVAAEFDMRARDFIEFVLDHYVNEGVEELHPDRLAPLLELRYGTLAEGLDAIGLAPDLAREAFRAFQQHLYAEAVT